MPAESLVIGERGHEEWRLELRRGLPVPPAARDLSRPSPRGPVATQTDEQSPGNRRDLSTNLPGRRLPT